MADLGVAHQVEPLPIPYNFGLGAAFAQVQEATNADELQDAQTALGLFQAAGPAIGLSTQGTRIIVEFTGVVDTLAVGPNLAYPIISYEYKATQAGSSDGNLYRLNLPNRSPWNAAELRFSLYNSLNQNTTYAEPVYTQFKLSSGTLSYGAITTISGTDLNGNVLMVPASSGTRPDGFFLSSFTGSTLGVGDLGYCLREGPALFNFGATTTVGTKVFVNASGGLGLSGPFEVGTITGGQASASPVDTTGWSTVILSFNTAFAF